MRPIRLAALIGALWCVGIAVVAARSAVWMKAYELGRRQDALSRTDVRTTWLKAEVLGLRSPATLVSRLSNDTHKLVAWSSLSHAADSMHSSHE
jgi:hypothetical protein